MNRCKNCAHWGVWSEGVCDRESQTQHDPETFFEIECYASDDTGLTYKLVTGPEFGCVQFKAKEEDSGADEYYKKRLELP